MTRRLFALALVIVVTLGSFGCVSQNKADQLANLQRRTEEQIVELKARLAEKDAEIAAMRDQGKYPSPEMLKQIQELERQRDAARAALADLEGRIEGLAVAPDPIALPHELDQALAALAAQHPELISYDAKLGMVKFRSDFTFDPGSDQVKAPAVSTLGQLAQVVRSPAALAYEARIVGHTDNVPIRFAKANHPTNWHLSVHRAIAVKNVLEQAGVPPVRMSVAGYGEYRPLVANGPKGSEANRRVEIFLVRSSAYRGNDTVSEGAPAVGPQADALPVEDPALFK